MSEVTTKRISETRVLAAMAHPLRRRLINVLKVDGPSTVSVLANRTDQNVGNISHHLRTLAAAGLVDEVPELARDRRERWWRLAATHFRWTSADFAGDAADEAVARAAAALDLEFQVAAVRGWYDASDDERRRWTTGPFNTHSWLRVTDAELAQFASELTDLVVRWADREIPDDGQSRETVFVFARGVPATP